MVTNTIDSVPNTSQKKSRQKVLTNPTRKKLLPQKKPNSSIPTVSGRLSHSSTVSQENGACLNNSKIEDFFPVRRSNRVPQQKIKNQQRKEFEEAILRDEEVGLKVVAFEDKGRGVVALRRFARNDFVVEYRGELIGPNEAKRRERRYNADPDVGCYMYYFSHRDTTYCVDATAESQYLGRLVNHSNKNPNCYTRAFTIDGKPRLVLVAARTIESGEEVLYDYGERSKEAVDAHPWLKNS